MLPLLQNIPFRKVNSLSNCVSFGQRQMQKHLKLKYIPYQVYKQKLKNFQSYYIRNIFLPKEILSDTTILLKYILFIEIGLLCL